MMSTGSLFLSDFHHDLYSHYYDKKHINSLAEVFSCMLCLERLTDARLCPHCSKLCCYACIKKWLSQQRDYCPHCRSRLELHDLVKCRWMEEVTEKINTLKHHRCDVIPIAKETENYIDRCFEHQKLKTVYCETCEVCICHLCALWGGKHSGHSFLPVDEVYDKITDTVKDQICNMKKRKEDLNDTIKSVENEISENRNSKSNRIREIRKVVENMVTRLETHLQEKLQMLTDYKSKLNQHNDEVHIFCESISTKLEVMDKWYAVSKMGEMITKASKLIDGPIENKPALGKITDFASEMIPEFETGEFVLLNFTQHQQRAAPVYSEPVHGGGQTWRLKVYPNGSGEVHDKFMSVFLELVAGNPESFRYEYTIELVSKDSSMNVLHEFTSNFCVGECWGYYRFFALDERLRDDYIDTEADSITFKYSVRPASFHQKCQNQQWYINKLEKSQEKYQTETEGLRKKLLLRTSDSQPDY